MRFWFRRFFSDWNAHLQAAEEVFFVCVIALIPLIALAVIDQLRTTGIEVSHLFQEAIAAGQLYLYSFALLGTLFWLCQKEHENLARFPPRKYLMFFVFVPSVLILVIYAIDPTMSKPLRPTFVTASFVVYSLYVALYYVLLVFDHLEPPPIEEGLQQEAHTLIEEYEQTGGL
jgi:uncharacterized membrane protein